jgi:hypothetical protein
MRNNKNFIFKLVDDVCAYWNILLCDIKDLRHDSMISTYFRKIIFRLNKKILILTIIILFCSSSGLAVFGYIKRDQLIKAHAKIISDNNFLQTSENHLIRIMFANEKGFDKLNDIQKIRFVRDWCLHNLPVSDSQFHGIPFGLLLEENLAGKRGVLCGGTGYILAKLYNALGYRSVSFNTGILNSKCTHAVTLVSVPFEDTEDTIILMDGLLGIEIVDKNGNPADILQIINNIYNNIPINNLYISMQLQQGQKLTLEVVKHKRHFINIDIWQKRSFNIINNCLSQYNYNEGYISLLGLPIGIGAESPELHKKLNDTVIGTMLHERGVLP